MKKNTILKRRKCYLGLPLSFTLYSIIQETEGYYLLIERGIFKQNKTRISLYKLDDISIKRNLFDLFLWVGYVYCNKPYMQIGKMHSCKKFARTIEELSKAKRKEINMSFSQTIMQ